MAKRALPLLTGGLNEVTRPDIIEDSQLQECTNYEITGDGVLKKRKAQDVYSSYLNLVLSAVFDINFIFSVFILHKVGVAPLCNNNNDNGTDRSA